MFQARRAIVVRVPKYPSIRYVSSRGKKNPAEKKLSIVHLESLMCRPHRREFAGSLEREGSSVVFLP